MIIQTNHQLATCTAQDSLEGLKALPGFIFGYLLLAKHRQTKSTTSLKSSKGSGDTLGAKDSEGLRDIRHCHSTNSEPLIRFFEPITLLDLSALKRIHKERLGQFEDRIARFR